MQTARTDRQARLKLAEKPNALVLCDAGGGPQTLRLLRELRAGEILGADARVPVLVVGAGDESAAVRLYRNVWGFEPDTGSPRMVDTAAHRLNPSSRRQAPRHGCRSCAGSATD